MTLIFSDDHKMFTLGRTLEVIQWFSSLGHIRNTWKAYYKTDGRLTPTVSNLAEFAFATSTDYTIAAGPGTTM